MVMFFIFLSTFLLIYIYISFTTQRHNFSHIPSSSPITTTAPQVKYDVFISFKGDDTRYGFTSHLYDALKRKQILTFMDNELVRGAEISPSLLKAIEGSKLSVLIFSENYAYSKWCLEELVKILECRKNKGQIVVPVFYLVDPSHVRNQTGSFGDAFSRLIKEKALAMDKAQSFRDALKDAANLSGWSLGKFNLESKFVEEIVTDIFNKLHRMSSSQSMGLVGTDAMGLVGIDARIEKIESLLNMESEDVPIVGIWGMGGIGKTTIANVVCQKNRAQFEKIFSVNFREELRTRSMADLQRSFLAQLLGQEILNMGILSFGDPFIRDRLRRMKVFIVIDNVDNSMQLQEWQELICRQHYSLGQGSKILVTSRDKQLLKEMVGEQHIYKVEGLNHKEALQLFSLKAFKNCCNPPINHKDLLERIVNYAQGNPLALIVLGSALNGKSIEEWSSALNKLALDARIQNVLRISYDGLDQEQKSIFLDIAHFFRKWEQKQATRTLDGLYGRSVIFDISTLVDKCLITISQSKIEMHDLLQEMAFGIVRGESKNPGKRSRLCDPDDVAHVLRRKKGSDRIEGIHLDMSKLSTEMHLESDAFSMMDNLRFFEFKHNANKVHLPSSGLEYLSDELRHLHWDGFPSKSLPLNFCAENLVELNLLGSEVEKLWIGVQDIINLRNINLTYCESLTELPDLSKANNLEFLGLDGCTSLIEVPSSLQWLEKLEELYLGECYNLRSLPSRFDSKFLRALTITRRPDMSKCPQIISGNMKGLDLRETSIREVPRSITSTLEHLDLSGCSNITKFPEVSGDIKHLNLSRTAIEEVPSTIQFFSRLITLDMSCCSKLKSFPKIREPMRSLNYLNLSGTSIKELPSSIKHLVSLAYLNVDGTPIRELPELAPALYSLTACDCASLETISIIDLSNFCHGNFANCFKLDQKAVVADMQLMIQSGTIPYSGIEMVLPGNQFPEWFSDQGVGSSVTVQFPLNCQRLKGFAFCLFFLLPLNIPSAVINFRCHVKTKNGEHGDGVFRTRGITLKKPHDSDYMFLKHQPIVSENRFSEYSGNEVTFEFYPEVVSYGSVRTKQQPVEIQKLCKLRRCGVYLHFDENLPSSPFALQSSRILSGVLSRGFIKGHLEFGCQQDERILQGG